MDKKHSHSTDKKDLFNKENLDAYLRGDLENSDMHQLEAESLNSEFYDDALEGLEAIDPQLLQDDLDDLGDRLNKRIQSGSIEEVKPLWPRIMGIAAAVTILITLSYLFYTPSTNEQIENVVAEDITESEVVDSSFNSAFLAEENIGAKEDNNTVEERSEETYEPKVADNGVVGTIELSDSREQNEVDFDSKEQKLSLSDVGTPVDINVGFVAPIQPIQPDGINDFDPMEANLPEIKGRMRSSAIVTTTDYVSGVETFVPGSGFGTQKVVTGRITSLDDGKPLSGVSVFNNNYNAARAISGSDGSFKIAVQDTSNVLTFSTSGYYQSEVQVGRDNILDIQMKDSLIEIKADSVSIVSRSMEILKPKESIKLVAALNYQQYLSDSLIYPQEATEKRISGEVELTIQISNDGSPISIVVSQSLGFGCDEEAIRLIKEGPKLIHLVDENEQSTEAVIIVEFRLKN